MKNIVICIPTLASAGAQRFATELACGINKNTYHPIVVVTNHLDEECAFRKKLLDNNIEVVDVSDHRYLKETWKILKVLRKYQPAIIHSNVGAALHVLLAQLLYRGKVKHLFTVHSMAYRIFSAQKKKIMKFCFQNKIIIPIAICDTVKQSLVESYDLAENAIECVYNGVDTELFYPNKNKTDEKFTFVTVGTLYHIKNHELLIHAFSIIRKRHDDVLLRIVGDGELRDKLNKQVNDLDLRDSVIFEGNQANVAYYLNKADVYCCSSKVEGLPISVLEAMACGLPVITTSAGGVVDIVTDNHNGFIVSNEPEAYAAAMETIYSDSELRNRMSENSREKALLRDLKICVSEYEYLYKKYGC